MLGTLNIEDNYVAYYERLRGLQKDLCIEVEIELGRIDGNTHKIRYIQGIERAVEVAKSYIVDSVRGWIEYIITPRSEGNSTNPQHKRLPIMIGDGMPTLAQLEEIEEILYINHIRGYHTEQDAEIHNILSYIQVHIHKLEEVERYLRDMIDCIERGVSYIYHNQPQSTNTIIAKIALSELYPSGVMTRPQVIDYLGIDKSTMTRYTNVGYITPINPNDKRYLFGVEEVVRLSREVGRKKK